MRRGLLVLLAGAAVVVAAAAGVLLRGGDGVSCSRGAPTDRPVCVAQAYVTTNGAEKCRLVAPALLQRLTQAPTPDAAQAACARNVARFPPAREVRIVEAEVTGAAAAVELLADGREGAMALERREGRWVITGFSE